MNQLTPNDKQTGIECLNALVRADSKDERGEQIKAIKDLFKLDAPPDDAVAVFERAVGMVQSDPDAAWTILEEHFAQHAPPVAQPVSAIEDPRPVSILSALKKNGAVLTAGEVCLLSGAGGIGKSALAGEIAMAVAGGSTTVPGLFNIGTSYQCKSVLWLTYEEARGELTERLKERCTESPEKDGEQLRDGLNKIHVLDMRAAGGWPLFGPSTERNSYSPPGRLRGWAPMETEADKLGDDLGLIVIDPVLSAYIGEQNDTTAVRAFLGELATLARKYEAGVLALAHSRKASRHRDPDPYDPGQVSGSSAWHDGVRGVLTFTFEKEPSRRVLAVAKANMGPARIECDTQPIRKDSGWIVGFKGKDDWSSNDGADKPKQQTEETEAAYREATGGGFNEPPPR